MNFTKNISLFLTLLFIFFVKATEPFISFAKTENSMVLKERNSGLMLFSDSDSDKGILRAVANLQSDFQKVTGVQPELISQNSGMNGMLIIIGEAGKSKTIDDLIKQKKLDGKALTGKREKYIIQNVSNPFPGVSEAIVIAGSDKRGTIYGIYEMSQQIGVSPWYYWADVPVEKKKMYTLKKEFIQTESLL
jgi:hypothetical protein